MYRISVLVVMAAVVLFLTGASSNSCANNANKKPAAASQAAPSASAAGTRTSQPSTGFTSEAVAKSIRDNRGFMPRASTDKLSVDVSSDFVMVTIQPTLLDESDALTVASQTALAASKATFSAYPEQQALMVKVLTEFTDQYGKTATDTAAMLQFNRPTAEQFDYDGLKNRVLDDNKLLFCVADKYQIHPAVYAKLKDTGCLRARGKL